MVYFAYTSNIFYVNIYSRNARKIKVQDCKKFYASRVVAIGNETSEYSSLRKATTTTLKSYVGRGYSFYNNYTK